MLRSNSSPRPSTPSFGYLLNMKLLNLTFERVEQLRDQHKKLNDEFEAMKQMSIKDLWIRDLDVFEQVYQQQVLAAHHSCSKGTWRTSAKTGPPRSPKHR